MGKNRTPVQKECISILCHMGFVPGVAEIVADYVSVFQLEQHTWNLPKERRAMVVVNDRQEFSSNTRWTTLLASPPHTSGKWYCSIQILKNNPNACGHVRVGVGPESIAEEQLGGGANALVRCPAWYEVGDVEDMQTHKQLPNTQRAHAYCAGDILGLALDLDNNMFIGFRNKVALFTFALSNRKPNDPFYFAACCGPMGKVRLQQPEEIELPEQLDSYLASPADFLSSSSSSSSTAAYAYREREREECG